MGKIVLGYADTIGIDAVGILSGEQNTWYPKGMSDAMQQRFKRRYDMTASDLGFAVNPNGIHYLDLRPVLL